MANFTWPSSSFTSGPLQFLKDSVQTSVTEDTSTPANNRPLPVKVTDGTNGLGITASNEAKVSDATAQGSLAAINTKVATETTLGALSAKLPTTLGQKAMAASMAVVIASDQSAIPVSGTVVTGGLTDTQLRATPVPVSGTVSTGGLTDTQLRASAVPVTANAGTNLNTSALNLEATQVLMSAKLPATLGQKAMAASMAVVIASDQGALPTKAPVNAAGNSPGSSTVSTVATLTAPANTVGFILMNLDTSTANIRYRIGAVATAALGQQLQAGRDTGYIPCAANVSICAESGTQNYDIQWILSA